MNSCLVCSLCNPHHELIPDVSCAGAHQCSRNPLLCIPGQAHHGHRGSSPSPRGTALGAAQEGSPRPSLEQHRPFSHRAGLVQRLVLVERLCTSVSPTKQGLADEQMLQSKGVAGGARLARGLCSPVAAEPQLITLTWLFLFFTAFVCIDPNCTR